MCGLLQASLANNLFASSCDSRRPIISFATFHLRSSSWPSVKSPSSNPAIAARSLCINKGMGRLDDDGDAVVVTVAEPVEGHVVLLTRLGRVTHKRFMGGQ